MMMLDSGMVRSLGIVAQYRKLADRPQLQQHRALGLVAEIDRVRHERRIVLVQGDQHLPAERRQADRKCSVSDMRSPYVGRPVAKKIRTISLPLTDCILQLVAVWYN